MSKVITIEAWIEENRESIQAVVDGDSFPASPIKEAEYCLQRYLNEMGLSIEVNSQQGKLFVNTWHKRKTEIIPPKVMGFLVVQIKE